jgi:hypothetical protein
MKIGNIELSDWKYVFDPEHVWYREDCKDSINWLGTIRIGGIWSVYFYSQLFHLSHLFDYSSRNVNEVKDKTDEFLERYSKIFVFQ